MLIPHRYLLSIALIVGACNGLGELSDPPQDQDPDGAVPDASKQTLAAKDFTKTRYPIVLAHGLGGARKIAGVVDYWYGITDDLKSTGAQVFVTQVSAANSSEARGEQLLQQIQQILAMTGAAKVNLVGHSQGGFDVRYVMGVRPDLIASLTTVAGPHLGADLADVIAANITPNGFSGALLERFGNALGSLVAMLADIPDAPQDALGALRTLSAAGASEFNRRFPAGLAAARCGATPVTNGTIPLFSWTGASVRTNSLDFFDPVLALSTDVYSEPNDGLVGRCSSHFGQVLRDDYQMNHLDEINQFFGLTSIFEVNPISVFRSHANRLKLAGL